MVPRNLRRSRSARKKARAVVTTTAHNTKRKGDFPRALLPTLRALVIIRHYHYSNHRSGARPAQSSGPEGRSGIPTSAGCSATLLSLGSSGSTRTSDQPRSIPTSQHARHMRTLACTCSGRRPFRMTRIATLSSAAAPSHHGAACSTTQTLPSPACMHDPTSPLRSPPAHATSQGRQYSARHT